MAQPLALKYRRAANLKFFQPSGVSCRICSTMQLASAVGGDRGFLLVLGDRDLSGSP